MVVHGNRAETLRDLMIAWMRAHPLAPLEDEVVLVQSNGVAQWVKLSLAREADDPQGGGLGIAAALRLQLPAEFTWQAYRAVLGAEAVPRQSPFDKAALTWRLMRLLPRLVEGEGADARFAPLQRFLADDPELRKRHQLAERIADLFDQYQVYRADWIADWAQGRDLLRPAVGSGQPVPDDQAWQPALWRALLQEVPPGERAAGRAEVHRRFVDAVDRWDGPRPAGLPRRITVFGISSLPAQVLQVLAALGRFCEVLLCVQNPCEHDWSHIVPGAQLWQGARHRQAQRRSGAQASLFEADLHAESHPLLAAWGKQGRDFIRLLDWHDEVESYRERFERFGRIDQFEPTPGQTLLQQLQDDIRDLRPLSETRAKWPQVDPRRDRSIEFHVAHSPQREVEVLHDRLLAAFAADPTLSPREVVVMVPDIAAYAPSIQAVFGLVGRDDPRHIPFTIADQNARSQDTLLSTVARLLHLPGARLGASELQDLLDVPALRRRFKIDDDQRPVLNRWIAAAQVRWGLGEDHRASLELPAGLAQNTWEFGLQRLLLGYASGNGPSWRGLSPECEVGGQEAALLGPLLKLLQALQRHWRALSMPGTPTEWAQRLRTMLADLFEAREATAEGLTLLRLSDSLQRWQDACADAGFDQPLPLAVVREAWLSRLDAAGLGQRFFAGGVTFASLMPMRAIPFRRVALLGMNDGDYPRSRVPVDFDLMALEHRPGDRSRREDDRYLFLEALLSARDQLHVSWVGRSIRDNEVLPPSVLVAQLRDHLAQGWKARGGAGLLEALTTEHRLQPFHPDYFDPRLPHLASHAREWRAALSPVAGNEATAPLAPAESTEPLTLRQLGDFLRHPVRAFFQHRLGVRFGSTELAAEDDEPFAAGGLDGWKWQDELIQAQRAALRAGTSREAALDAQLQRLAERGVLPLGGFAEGVRAALAEPMARLFDAYAKAQAEWPQECPPEPVSCAGPQPGLVLEDWLDGLRSGPGGARARITIDSSSLIEEKPRSGWRRDKLLVHWVVHLVGNQSAPMTSVIVSKKGVARLQPLSPDAARAHLHALMAARQDGLRRPLPLPVKSAFTWLGTPAVPDADAPRRAARSSYEDHDPAYGRRAEMADCAYLARAYPDFDSVWGEDFQALARRLLQPLCEALGPAPDPRREAAP